MKSSGGALLSDSKAAIPGETEARAARGFVCMIAYTNYALDARVRREAETLVSHGFHVRA